MSLLQNAQAVFNGLLEQRAPQNCYWYGWVVVAADGNVTPHVPGDSKCGPPPLQPPVDVGWLDPHGTPLVGTNGAGEIAYTDCSGFVSYLIYKESARAYEAVSEQLAAITDTELLNYLEQINTQHGQSWPSAADYAVLGMPAARAMVPFHSLGGNETLDLDALQPGDIVAWGLDPGGTDTGHVVILQETPVEQEEGTWELFVIDSSVLLHGSDKRPGGSGVGTGTILLQQTTDGIWSINFNYGDDQFRPTRYTSALRLTV